MSVDVKYFSHETPMRAVVKFNREGDEGLVVPPVALPPGEWTLVWDLEATPVGVNEVRFPLGLPTGGFTVRKAPCFNGSHWVAEIDNLPTGDVSAFSYTIALGQLPPQDPTIVVTKDPIDTAPGF